MRRIVVFIGSERVLKLYIYLYKDINFFIYVYCYRYFCVNKGKMKFSRF